MTRLSKPYATGLKTFRCDFRTTQRSSSVSRPSAEIRTGYPFHKRPVRFTERRAGGKDLRALLNNIGCRVHTLCRNAYSQLPEL